MANYEILESFFQQSKRYYAEAVEQDEGEYESQQGGNG